jgi:hypothetical protein
MKKKSSRSLTISRRAASRRLKNLPIWYFSNWQGRNKAYKAMFLAICGDLEMLAGITQDSYSNYRLKILADAIRVYAD